MRPVGWPEFLETFFMKRWHLMLHPPVGVHLVISEFAQEPLEPPRGFRTVRKLVAPMALAQTLYYNQSIACSKQARDLLACCGMSGGVVSHGLAISEAEAHMLKSQYLEARNILVQALQTISAGQDLCEYGMVQLNLAQIDVCVGATQTTIQQEIDKAKTIFKMLGCPRILQLTEVLQADLTLMEGDMLGAKTVFQHNLSICWGRKNERKRPWLWRFVDAQSVTRQEQ
jgi:hypothetical protein